MISLENKIVLITGSSSGIGEACAKVFSKLSARIILCARRMDRLEELAGQLVRLGKTPYILPLDVSDRHQVNARLSSLPPEWQDVDILINNAGLALDSVPLHEGNVDNWEIMLNTNVNGLLYVSHAIIPKMIKRSCGHIINIGSIAGQEAYPNGNIYCATKAAVRSISKSMRLDLLGTPVRVTEIAPGAVETEFSEVRFKDKARAKSFYKDFEPLRAEDIADAVLYAATRPLHVDIEQMVIMPTAQASANHIHRKA